MVAESSSGTVTLLFTDLVGSTEGRGRLGEEAAEALRRTHDRLMANAIESHGGQVVKHLGDGVMATFAGAADGLSAAVAVQRAVGRHNRSADGAERLEVRAGLSAGDVTFEEGDVFGTPVIEAARLCAAARGAQILAADVVRVLAGSRGGHRFVPAGALELKGLPGPVTAVEVAWEAEAGSAIPLPVALSRPGSFRFVSREEEVDVLTRAWKEAAAGDRRVVLVSGEAGVGKTRLVAEAVRRFHSDGSVVLFGRCEEELGIPYQPFAEALSDYVAAVPLDELRSQLGSLGGELARLAPSLPERITSLAEPLQAEPETERYRLFEAVRELLTAVSDAAPVVLVLDDLQWAARPTLALLVHLVRRAERARLLVVATYRDTDLGRNDPLADVLADLRRSSGTDRLALGGLDQAGAVAFVESLTGHALEDDMLAVTRAVWTETEGNPFFLGEVMRHLVETGVAAEVDGRWHVIRPLEQLGIPEGVREVVGRRLSRLPEAANEVLAIAAVIGREFDVGLLADVVGGVTDVVLEAMEQAEAARLVVPRRGRPGCYAFAHALVRSTLYEELPSVGRLRLHRRVGLALEHRVGAALPELARHFVEAAPLGESARAVDYARQAGDRARDGLAMDEAAAHYELALNALEFSGEGDPALRCDLLIARGDALYRARDRRYRKVFAAAASAARELGDARRLARVAVAHNPKLARPVGTTDEGVVALAEEALAALPPADDPLRARLLAVLALELAWSPDADRRRSLLEQAKAMAERLGDRRVLADVLIFRRWADTNPQDLPARLAVAGELMALAEQLGDVEATCIGGVWLGMCHFEDLDTPALVSGIESAAALVGQLRQPLLATEVAGGRTMTALLLGRLDEAARLMAEEQDLGIEAGMPSRTVIGHFATQQFVLSYELGRPHEAVEALGMVETIATESNTARPGFQAMLGLAYAEAGERERAVEILDELAGAFHHFPRVAIWLGTIGTAGRLAAALGDAERARTIYDLLVSFAGRGCWNGPAVVGPVDPVLALLAATAGDFDVAEEHFARAVELCRARSLPTWLARSQQEWAEMLVTRGAPGDADRARQLATEALAGAEALGMAGVVGRSRAVLETVS